MDAERPSRKWVYITLCLLYLPLIESLATGTLGGLNWHSPLAMALTGHYIRFIKLGMVMLGLALLLKMERPHKQVFASKVTQAFFIYSGYIVASAQIAMLCFGLLLSGVIGLGLSPPHDIHRQQTFEEHVIYVYTADPGAMGTAYHYFSLVCGRPFNRYRTVRIAKLPWMSSFSFDVQGDTLTVSHQNYKGEQSEPYHFDLSQYSCGGEST